MAIDEYYSAKIHKYHNYLDITNKKNIWHFLEDDLQTSPPPPPSLKKSRFDFLVKIVDKRSELNEWKRKN